MTSVANWAHAGFALGYAEHGHFPLSRRTQATCLAIQESATEFDSPKLAHLIVEAGRTEGKRSARETAHRKLYAYHGAELAAALDTILARLDLDPIVHDIMEHARQQSDAGSDPVTRRRAVQGIALAAITDQVHADDRKTLNDLNADGWAHATAYGSAEAVATPPKGGSPDPAKIAAAASLIVSQIDLGTAASAAVGWTQLELQTIAMAAALAAGDGSALGDATRNVTKALVDSGRATKAYANQLHQTVTQVYVGRTQIATPGVMYDWVTADDPCDNCEAAELAGPYSADSLPDGPPLHPNCVCDLEVTADSPALVNA